MTHDTQQDDEEPTADKAVPAETYRIGYGRPPLETRFQPGASGNRKGRPRGRQELKRDLHEELSEQITLREGDRTVRMTKQRALVKSTVARAIKGDASAQAKAFELLLKAFGIGDNDQQSTQLTLDDEAIVKAFLERAGEAK